MKKVKKSKRNFKFKTIIVLSLFMAFLTFNLNAQTEGDLTNKALTWAEEMPEYPGGEEALKQDIANSIVYPKEAVKLYIQGTVYVRFIVNKDGNIENAEILRGAHRLLDEEALRVINSLDKKWKPAKQEGKIVNVYYILPLVFRLDND